MEGGFPVPARVEIDLDPVGLGQPVAAREARGDREVGLSTIDAEVDGLGVIDDLDGRPLRGRGGLIGELLDERAGRDGVRPSGVVEVAVDDRGREVGTGARDARATSRANPTRSGN
jgi:hypothetical protein